MTQHNTPHTQHTTEIIYLSRHAAASGKPSLTIHPIGNPGQPLPPADDTTARAEHGGIPGKCVPPSPRMASLYRQLLAAVRDAGMLEDFEVTMEATHHGPWLETPCCFVEIGSKDEDWGRQDASGVWADVLERNLRLTEGAAAPAPPLPQAKAKVAVVSLGGGHYTPKSNDLLRHTDDEVLIGHMLASYCFTGPPEIWQQGVLEAVAATRAAAGEHVPVVVYVDKKSFKAELRNAVLAFLEARGIPFGVKENELLGAVERAAAATKSK